jgi:hypothetical protein
MVQDGQNRLACCPMITGLWTVPATLCGLSKTLNHSAQSSGSRAFHPGTTVKIRVFDRGTVTQFWQGLTVLQEATSVTVSRQEAGRRGEREPRPKAARTLSFDSRYLNNRSRTGNQWCGRGGVLDSLGTLSTHARQRSSYGEDTKS